MCSKVCLICYPANNFLYRKCCLLIMSAANFPLSTLWTIIELIVCSIDHQSTLAVERGWEKMLTLCLLVSSTDNLCKQIGPRSGPTKCRLDLDPNCLTLWWYSWKNFQKNWFWKNQVMTKKHKIFPSINSFLFAWLDSLRPSQYFFSHVTVTNDVGTRLPGSNQY